jgi:signal transduction protein with GAF and PtsI domain
MYLTPNSKLTKYYEDGVKMKKERNKQFRELTGINPLGL